MPELNEKLIGDLMQPPESLPYLDAEAGLPMALALMLGNFSGENEMKPALVRRAWNFEGFVRPVDLLAALKPGETKEKYYRGWSLPGYWSSPTLFKGFFTRKCRGALKLKVKDVMRPLKMHLKPEDTLDAAAFLFSREKTGWLTVGEKGRLLGVLNLYDYLGEVKQVWDSANLEHEPVLSILSPGEQSTRAIYG